MAAARVKIDAKCDVSGALADGRSDELIRQWQEAVTDRLSLQGIDMLKELAPDKTGRGRGGFQRSLKQVRKSPGLMFVPGPQIEGVTWASWLEGISQRNKSTGYRGVRMFSKTQRALSKSAVDVGEEELQKLLPEIGGE